MVDQPWVKWWKAEPIWGLHPLGWSGRWMFCRDMALTPHQKASVQREEVSHNAAWRRGRWIIYDNIFALRWVSNEEDDSKLDTAFSTKNPGWFNDDNFTSSGNSINFWFDMPFAIKPLLSLSENRVLPNPLIYHNNNNHHHLNIKMAIWGYGMPHVHNQISPQVGYIVLRIYIYISREFPWYSTKHQHEITLFQHAVPSLKNQRYGRHFFAPGVESMLRAFKKLEKDPDIYVPSSAVGEIPIWCRECLLPSWAVWKNSQWSRFLLYTDHLTMTYWCLVGNGWDWGNGMIITSDYGSFPHSLLSTSKILITWKWGRLAAYPTIQTRNRGDVERGLEQPVLAGERWVDQLMRFDPRTRTSWSICLLLSFGRYLQLFAVPRQHWWLISYWKHDPE